MGPFTERETQDSMEDLGGKCDDVTFEYEVSWFDRQGNGAVWK